MHVYPENGVEGAHIDIYTVITADYNESEQLQVFNEEVEPLREDNRFTVPLGLKLFVNEEGRDKVTYPYIER